MLGKFATIKAMYSDASNWGLSATFGNDWLVSIFRDREHTAMRKELGHPYAEVPRELASSHINIKEVGAVMEGAKRWAPYWGDLEIMFVTDSSVMQAAVNTGRSRSLEIMGMLRELFWLAVEYNFTCRSIYINISINMVCDALNRLEKHDCKDRIRGVDLGRMMCCTHIFDSLPLCGS